MATTYSITDGTSVTWADTTDYSSTVSGLTRTHQLDLTSVAASGAREGAKADLGATRAARYAVLVGIEFAVAPSSGDIVTVAFGFSPSGTAGNANPGGLTGADGAYTGTAGDALSDSLTQLNEQYRLVCTSDATTTVQYARIGTLWYPSRYVSPVVYNEADQALVADATEMYVALLPISDYSA